MGDVIVGMMNRYDPAKGWEVEGENLARWD
jgi:hypothetical protein